MLQDSVRTVYIIVNSDTLADMCPTLVQASVPQKYMYVYFLYVVEIDI